MPTNAWNLRDETRAWVFRIRQAVATSGRAGVAVRSAVRGARTSDAVRMHGGVQAAGAAYAQDTLKSVTLKSVIEELKTQSIPCRLEVAAAIGSSSDAKMVAALEALRTDPSPSVRFVVADALRRIRGQQAIDALLSIAENDHSDVVRVQALDALSLLILNQRGFAREQAGRAAGSLEPKCIPGMTTKDREILRVLQRLASGDRSDRVRQAAQNLLDALRVSGDAASPTTPAQQ